MRKRLADTRVSFSTLGFFFGGLNMYLMNEFGWWIFFPLGFCFVVAYVILATILELRNGNI